MPSSGVGGATNQSLPNARAGLRVEQRAERVGRRDALGPMTFSAQRPSSIAWYGCMLAMTPSSAKRGMSGGARCCACSMRKRRSRGPFSFSTRSKMSSCVRIARSPMACTITCRPALSARRGPRVEIAPAAFTSRPRSFGASVNGRQHAAVCEPSEPSTKPFSPPIRSHSSPRPSGRARRHRVAQPLPGRERHHRVDARRSALPAFRARAKTRQVVPRCPCGARPTSRPARRRTASPVCSAGRASRRGGSAASRRRRARRVVLQDAGRLAVRVAHDRAAADVLRARRDRRPASAERVRERHVAVEPVDPHRIVGRHRVDPARRGSSPPHSE